MISDLFRAFLLDELRAHPTLASDHTLVTALHSVRARRALLLAKETHPRVGPFLKHLVNDSAFWSANDASAPKTAYEQVRAQMMRTDALASWRRRRTQQIAATVLRRHGMPVDEYQLAAPVALKHTRAALVTIERSLLGGGRVFRTGTVVDRSWRAALRTLFSK